MIMYVQLYELHTLCIDGMQNSTAYKFQTFNQELVKKKMPNRIPASSFFSMSLNKKTVVLLTTQFKSFTLKQSSQDHQLGLRPRPTLPSQPPR